MSIQTLNYCQERVSDQVVPKPAVLRSLGWDSMYLELHHQPTFATAEHQHTMHVVAYGLTGLANQNVPGGRSLDGKRSRERRGSDNIAIIPVGAPHFCRWDAPTQFIVLTVEPALLIPFHISTQQWPIISWLCKRLELYL